MGLPEGSGVFGNFTKVGSDEDVTVVVLGVTCCWVGRVGLGGLALRLGGRGFFGFAGVPA